MVLRRSQKEISKSDRFLYILSTVMSVGEYDKVVQGVFENYPNIRYRDPSMRMVSVMVFCLGCTVNSTCRTLQVWTLPHFLYGWMCVHAYMYVSVQLECRQYIELRTISKVLRALFVHSSLSLLYSILYRLSICSAHAAYSRALIDHFPVHCSSPAYRLPMCWSGLCSRTLWTRRWYPLRTTVFYRTFLLHRSLLTSIWPLRPMQGFTTHTSNMR